MNERQLLLQIRHRLREATWPGGGSKVFGESVAVTAGPHESGLAALRSPLCLIRPGPVDHDPEARSDPGHVRAQFQVRLIASVPGDAVGEAALVRGSPVSESESGGKGLLEIQERLYSELLLLQSESGVEIQSTGQHAVDAVSVEGLGYVAYRDLGFEAWVTTTPAFPEPVKLESSAAGGIVNLTWKNPADRFDRLKVTVQRVSGSSAPEDHLDGVTVKLDSSFEESVTDQPGPGTWTYGVFCHYDDRNEPPTVVGAHVSEPATETVTL